MICSSTDEDLATWQLVYNLFFVLNLPIGHSLERSLTVMPCNNNHQAVYHWVRAYLRRMGQAAVDADFERMTRALRERLEQARM